MERNIKEEIERLKHDYKDLKSEINELNNAVNKSQISISRKRGVYTSAGATCEAILKFIYQKEGGQGKPVNKLMLDELLIKIGDFIPPQVMINFRTIQAWRNLGTHDKDDMRSIDINSLIMVDMALSNIVNWFFTSYMKIDYSNENLYKVVEITEPASIVFQLDGSFNLDNKAVTITYESTTTFQKVLNTLYEEFLCEIVAPYTYGSEWIIHIHDGKGVNKLNKLENPDLRIFQEILKNHCSEPYRLTICRC
jgi:hypothetical protein